MSTRLLATIAGTVLRSELGSIGSMSDFPASGSRFGFSGAWLTEVLSWRGRKYQVVCLDRNIFLMLKAPPPPPLPRLYIILFVYSANGLFWSFRQTQTRRTDGNPERERSASPLYAPRAHPTTHSPTTDHARAPQMCQKSFQPKPSGRTLLGVVLSRLDGCHCPGAACGQYLPARLAHTA